MSAESSKFRNEKRRAGIEPAYTIRSSIYATFIAVGSLLALSLSAAVQEEIGLGGLCTVGAFLPVVAIPIALVSDRRPERAWGRSIVQVLQGLSLVLGLVSWTLFLVLLFLLIQSGGAFLAPNAAALAGGLLGLAINSLVVYWFIRYRTLFNEDANEVAGPQIETEGGTA